jgi:peptidoglycan/LPS O-acetylase OafA/YrhL
MPELDVLRGLAILAVLFYHGLYWSNATSSNHLATLFIKATVVGWLGVNLFFVLSGFLITGILIDTKGRPSFYRKFYLRRALRILPAYLALVIFLLLIGWLSFGSATIALLFLANNYRLNTFFHVGYGPLWSLSVEEQFYLIWPSIVGRVSVHVLTFISLALCLVEPFLRWLDASGHLPLGDVNQATYLISDNLALGALAAIFARSSYGTLRNGVRFGLGLCMAGLAIFAVGYPFGILHRVNVVGNTLQSVPWNIFFTGMLLLALGLRSPLASSIWAAPLRFFGYISYGLYLVHYLIFVSYDNNVPRLFGPFWGHLLQGSFTRFFLAGGLSVLVAWLSRRSYEERFLQMGRTVRPVEEASLASRAMQEDPPLAPTSATAESTVV